MSLELLLVNTSCSIDTFYMFYRTQDFCCMFLFTIGLVDDIMLQEVNVAVKQTSQPTFQRRINVVSTLSINVEITLIRR